MILPIQPTPSSQPYSKPLKQRVGDVANTALNVFSLGFGIPFAGLVIHCFTEDAKILKKGRWLACWVSLLYLKLQALSI